jgi:hypothetical protein
VALNDDGSAAARRFHERVRNPLLTDISIDWGGLPVADVYPKQIPDLFGAKPVILSGRYTGNGKGTIRLKGKMSGVDFVREIPVDFSSSQSQNDVLGTLWARTRVDDLMSQDFKGAQQGVMKDDVKQAVIQLGLDYRLMTQFTSFVAVEEMIVTDGGQPRRIDVPVEVPEGVNHAAVFGERGDRPMVSFGAGYGRNVSNLYANPSSPIPRGAQQTVTVVSGAEVINSTPKTSTMKETPPPSKAMNNYRIDGFSDTDVIRNLSPEEQKRVALQSKFHPSVLAVIDRLKAGKIAAGPDENKFIHSGKAEIQIFLTDKSAETMAKLKELGFEVVLDPKSANLVIGRLSIEKLAALAELKSVRYVAPQMSGN